ncbi:MULTISPECIES: isochorismatase family cysteine hydrolase [Achromobacter]|uniref:isochorismatase family cysteine hydrolase n=1 Tax=Achromobacter TaxID=222 RepID=UPI000DD17847|nr:MULTISPECIES: isochorismatase family cysteine hydrolase [Achromobacter]GLK98140.1 hydrolase [Achromobacter xylosoxidans]AXA73198.1 hydrolase [Achromobacter insolitus]MCP1405731.1 nicotinamidase-related amidase [Achromobacter insolitus]MEB3099403.1 isochorismatase family cysteine hydrolase [Achromobacter sp. D10]NGT14544.1 cysteine hydrolase [Achromobacter insolitus]
MEFPQWVKDRVIARQGCLHPYDELPAARLAVVVVDMQQYFTLPGYQGECAPAREIIAPINRLCDAVRAAGGTIVWVQTASDNADSFWSHHHGVMLTPERSARRLETLRRDAPGYALHHDLHAHDADLRVTKRFYSAMAPGSSELEPLLRGRGVDTLLIAGTVTNVCCESTARDAMMRDFRTIMVDDALAAVTPAEHENALHGWMLFFGDVLSVDESIARLKPVQAARKTA